MWGEALAYIESWVRGTDRARLYVHCCPSACTLHGLLQETCESLGIQELLVSQFLASQRGQYGIASICRNVHFQLYIFGTELAQFLLKTVLFSGLLQTGVRTYGGQADSCGQGFLRMALDNGGRPTSGLSPLGEALTGFFRSPQK